MSNDILLSHIGKLTLNWIVPSTAPLWMWDFWFSLYFWFFSKYFLLSPRVRMRRDRSSGSFRKDRKEKPGGLSRALSWLSVSSLSRQTRRIFRSQSELHTHFHTHSRSHTHLHPGEAEDEEDWVYEPQHRTRTGETWRLANHPPRWHQYLDMTSLKWHGGNLSSPFTYQWPLANIPSLFVCSLHLSTLTLPHLNRFPLSPSVFLCTSIRKWRRELFTSGDREVGHCLLTAHYCLPLCHRWSKCSVCVCACGLVLLSL